MRLVVFSREFPEYCFRYANAMARHCEVLLVLDRRNTEALFDVMRMPRQPDLTIRLLESRNPVVAIGSTISALKAIISFRPDYVHLQEIPDRAAPLLAFALKCFCKIVWTVHDPTAHSGRDSQLPADKRFLRAAARRIADVIVTHGTTCGKMIRKDPRFRDRVVISEHGVLMVPEEETVQNHSKTVLFFGRMEVYKGLDVLIDAAEILDGRGIQYEMIIAGEGPELDRNRHRLVDMPKIKVIPGFVSANAALDLFRKTDIVVLPYKDATQSGVVAAAFGNHRPVIASRVGGLPDIVEHGVNGLLVEPNNAQALADALQEVLENPALLEELNRGVKATAAGKLNWNNIASGLMQHLDTQRVRSLQPV